MKNLVRVEIPICLMNDKYVYVSFEAILETEPDTDIRWFEMVKQIETPTIKLIERINE